MTQLYKNYSEDGLTVGELKKILENIPDNLSVCVKTLNEHFPAHIVTLGERNLYPMGCNGEPQGTKECIKIE